MPDNLQLQLANQLGLIFHNERQPDELISPGLAKIAQDLLNHNPKTYGNICLNLLDGLSVHATAKKLKQSLDLVRFISRLHPQIRQASQAHTLNNLHEALLNLSIRLATESLNIPPKDLPRAIQVTTEQLALLTGHATQRLEINNVPSREKLLNLYKSFQTKIPTDVQNDHDVIP